ncbi:YfiR family protein [Neptunomonas antarctica]|uniref:YfiR family protein n=1 Tax=Neptunomonas antarctica TaxID=619304 RepID=A0A1N7NM89_9GAMM|nr:YfiR family protein [Neptunomonas antarctica]SIS99299.1 protein of unknown function [Neptunomonas antarctica]
MAVFHVKFRLIIQPILLISCLLSGAVAQAGESVIDNIKSVYIYNFLSFIQWPDSKVVTGDYRLCVIADQALIDKLSAVVHDEQMNERSIIIVPFNYVNDVRGECHLLYLQERLIVDAEQLTIFEEQGTLLIGDASGFVTNGIGMVGFETRGRKVRVAMNLTRLQDAGFKVSSKLLRVVRIER